MTATGNISCKFEHSIFLLREWFLFFRQRQEFRASNGKEKVWGKEPEYIVAKYTTKDGEVRTSLLLCSGWWALSR